MQRSKDRSIDILNKWLAEQKCTAVASKRIAEGQACAVFDGVWDGVAVAIKSELNPSNRSQLVNEFKVYRKLGCFDSAQSAENADNAQNAKSAHFARCYFFCKDKTRAVLIMDLFEAYLKAPQMSYMSTRPPGYINTVARHVLIRLNCLHRSGYVHRDVKPSNILMKRRAFYVVDLGLARPFEYGKPTLPRVMATPRYTSLPVMLGDSHFPVDDLISLMYTLACISSNLNWTNQTPEKHMIAYKQSASPHTLFRGQPNLVRFAQDVLSLRRDAPYDLDRLLAHFPLD